MDTLPEFTRFTQTVPISLLDDLSNTENLDFETFINGIDFEENETDSMSQDDSNSAVYQMALFAQTNSRLKLLVLSSNISKENYQIENVIRIVIRLV